MNRRRILAAAAALASAAVLGAEPKRAYRVGVLGLQSKGDAELVRILIDRLAAAGIVQGRNLTIQLESIELDGKRARDLAHRLVLAAPDVIYAVSEPLVDVLKAETQRIPIVFIAVTDPVARGYVATYARPGGNITGISDRYVEAGIKRLELLREAFPRARRVAFVSHHDDLFGFDEWKAAAATLAFEVIDVDLSQPGVPMESALEKARAQGADCLFPIGPLQGLGKVEKGDPLAIFLRFAARYRLPAIFSGEGMVRTLGGLMSLDLDVPRIFERAADMIVRILGGESPSTIPVEQPDRFVLAVNLATARAQGLSIPASVLLRANTVIE